MLLVNGESVEAIREWAEKMGIDKGAPIKQWLKIREEYGELCAAVLKNHHDRAVDAVGDVFVTLVVYGIQTNKSFAYEATADNMGPFKSYDADQAVYMLERAISADHNERAVVLLERIANHFGTNVQNCVDLVLDVLNNRSATMVDGTLVKESDR